MLKISHGWKILWRYSLFKYSQVLKQDNKLYGYMAYQKSTKDTPLRPILSSVGSYNHECAKWLPEILTPLRHNSTTVKDTFEFLHRLQNILIDNKIMGSFDVGSLFTNIPVDFTINLINLLENIFSNGVKDFNGLSELQLKKLLHWTTKGTVFQFQGELCEQTDGIAMGSPIAPLLGTFAWIGYLTKLVHYEIRIPC